LFFASKADISHVKSCCKSGKKNEELGGVLSCWAEIKPKEDKDAGPKPAVNEGDPTILAKKFWNQPPTSSRRLETLFRQPPDEGHFANPALIVDRLVHSK
jgi:hypothetical protein